MPLPTYLHGIRTLCVGVFLALFLAAAAVESCDTTCLSEAGATAAHLQSEPLYHVVSPLGLAEITMIKQAPRLDTLEGKTIAVVGGSFMAYVTHPEIKRLIRKNYPTAKVILLNEIGAAGPFPGPGISRAAKETFDRKLKEMKVDAVISGNGGCGLCTPKEAGSSIAAEYLGIPAVTIAAPGFVTQVVATAVNHGVPAPRVATYPGAFAAHTRQELLDNTQNVLWPQIVEALTKPLSANEIASNSSAAASNPKAIVFSGSLNDVNRHFNEMSWSDGLPIIPPTPARIEEFLHFTDLAWDHAVGVLPVAYRTTLVWHVAANGVMAGCPPEFMPLLIAFSQALGDPLFRRSLASTHGWTPYCWINGPIARQLGIDSQQGQISSPRNLAIGRFISLAMLNLGGYYIKENRMGTFGYLMPWCLVEDEAACLRAGWKPYHVQQGFTLNQNTLTAGSALLWGNNLTPATPDPEIIMQMMAWDVVEKKQFATGSGRPFLHRTLLVTEYIARDLASSYASKEALEKALIATARRPAYERAFANYWANPGSAFAPDKHSLERHLQQIIKTEQAELTELPPWFPRIAGMEKIHTVPVMQAGMTPILVSGDPNRNKVQCLPGGGYATIRINLPKSWDTSMEKLGYPPLQSFYLK